MKNKIMKTKGKMAVTMIAALLGLMIPTNAQIWALVRLVQRQILLRDLM
jgi:hypothetical protein